MTRGNQACDCIPLLFKPDARRLPRFNTVSGYNSRQRDFTTRRTPVIGHGLPLINVQEASHLFLAADSPTIIQATVSLSSSPKLHFKVYAYLLKKGALNKGLRRISPHIPWRGELVVFRLSERVPFLRSLRGASQKDIHRVIRL
ncbi:hypothetical protein BDN71DRAFT_1435289 [Pleurotus eryngii]|uniref:Uncharacterized protein n=1 Tax=Pleurotus eryngii TaxID=5323 RepID=A0A9P5ZLG4_PLEER|nr:hypothetical protein BDN71DRAFT_1435289 [Pleurotus eryngii]